MTLSKNALGIILLIVSMFGLDIPQEMIVDSWNGAITIISLGLMIYNQVSRFDTKWFIFKR
jgi:hypothetical protein